MTGFFMGSTFGASRHYAVLHSSLYSVFPVENKKRHHIFWQKPHAKLKPQASTLRDNGISMGFAFSYQHPVPTGQIASGVDLTEVIR